MTELSPNLRALADAIQTFASAVKEDDRNVYVNQALVVYEVISFDADGDPVRQISYAVPTENFSLSGGLGLIEAGRRYIHDDLFGDS